MRLKVIIDGQTNEIDFDPNQALLELLQEIDNVLYNGANPRSKLYTYRDEDFRELDLWETPIEAKLEEDSEIVILLTGGKKGAGVLQKILKYKEINYYILECKSPSQHLTNLKKKQPPLIKASLWSYTKNVFEGCCIRDEGRFFETGLQELVSNSRKLLQAERLRW